MNASLSRYTASSILDRRILLNICKHASKDDVLSLSLVSREWRIAAQCLLFREVIIYETIAGIPTRQAAMAERLFWVHRSLTMSPHLALYIENISYDPLNLPDLFAVFAQVMHLVKHLNTLWLYLDNRKPTQVMEALKYRGLFQSLKFPRLLIHARQLDCIMYIPTRRFSLLSIQAIGTTHTGGTNRGVDLTEYRLNAESITITNFMDEHPYGLGSSLWYTSSLLAVCLSRPVRLEITECPISAIRLHRLLRSLGLSIEHLRLLCSGWSSTYSSKSAKTFQATVEATFQWPSLLPKIKQLDTTFVSSSMGSLQTLEVLTFSTYDNSLTTALKALKEMGAILYNDSCSKLEEIHLLCLTKVNTYMESEQIGVEAPNWQQVLLRLETQIQEREIDFAPASIFREAHAMLDLILPLCHSNAEVRARGDASSTDIGFAGNVEAIDPLHAPGVTTFHQGQGQAV